MGFIFLKGMVMKVYQLVLTVFLIVGFYPMQAAMEHESFVDPAKESEKSRKEKEAQDKKNDDLQAQRKAQADKLASDALKSQDSDSNVEIKSIDRSQENPFVDTTFDLTTSLLDEDKITQDQAIHDNKFNSVEDFFNYISYKLEQLSELLPSGLHDDLDTTLRYSRKKIKEINEQFIDARSQIDQLKEKYINSYNEQTGTYGYDEATFQKDVKEIIEPVIKDVNTLISNISNSIKATETDASSSNVQIFLKDFSADMKMAIENKIKEPSAGQKNRAGFKNSQKNSNASAGSFGSNPSNLFQ